MALQKSGPFLYDDTTGDVVGFKDADGSENYFPSAAFTWANLPPAARSPGSSVLVSDVGVMLRVASDGARWVPDGMQCLARSAVKVDLTGTTNETALATVTIPGGAMGLNGGLLIYTSWSYTNSANTKTSRIRFGGAAGTQYFSNGQTTSATMHILHRIRNRNSASSQVGGSSATGGIGGVSSGVLVTSALDTLVAQDIVLSGQLQVGTETLTLESYEVWLLP